MKNKQLTTPAIAAMWLPLSVTWLLMAAEGPLLAAIVARMSDVKTNLAAWGVAFSIAVIMESPIIMLMSASTKLARDRQSYLGLRRFSLSLNLLVTAVMGLLLVSGGMSWIVHRLVGLPATIATLSVETLWVMLPWPAAIGLRRFYQGLLITAGKTRLIAVGTALRLSTVAAGALIIHTFTDLPGALMAGISITAAVVVEALASRIMCATTVARLLRDEPLGTGASPANGDLTLRRILSFYTPLALTSVIALAVHPTVTFFLGHSVQPVASLAVFPVITGFIFLFRGTFGLSFQELALSLLESHPERLPQIIRFAGILAATATAILSVAAFTPVGSLWFENVAGLSPELLSLVYLPLSILVMMPAASVLLSFQRASLMAGGDTNPITLATIAEVGVTVVVLILATRFTTLTGATAGALALMLGRLCANGLLVLPVSRALGGIRQTAVDVSE